jgi:protoporphyrinogen oxidase
VIDCFGERLYRIFFKTYTEKVWGIPCSQIRADWAAQRIQNMSLKQAVINAIFGSQNAKSLIKKFDYPRLGPGMMWSAARTARCARFRLCISTPKWCASSAKATGLPRWWRKKGDLTFDLVGDHFINSMPISLLVNRLDPPPPKEVLAAARGLKYRDFLIVSLIIDNPDLFPDNWLYIHSPEFKVGRIQNFKNWSPEMVPDSSKTCLGMEYFCSEGMTCGRCPTRS